MQTINTSNTPAILVTAEQIALFHNKLLPKLGPSAIDEAKSSLANINSQCATLRLQARRNMSYYIWKCFGVPVTHFILNSPISWRLVPSNRAPAATALRSGGNTANFRV
jgi:hypothetical protein